MKDIFKRITPDRAKGYVHTGILQYRKTTWSKRSLPDFIIVGAQKSGTSSLHRYLSQHPQIIPAINKEVHYFCGGLDPDVDTYSKGEPWYRAHFPLRKTLASNQRTFETTPLYMHNPLAAERIAELIPETKLVMLLRNPTERAISHYFHARRLGYEGLDINNALRREEGRLKPLIEAQDYKNTVFIRNSYKMRGLYKQQLSRYLGCFRREQILVLSSEQFFNAPKQVLRQVFEFVGVNPDYEAPNLSPRNVGKNRIIIEPSVYEYLNNFFELPNRELYELLGEEYGW